MLITVFTKVIFTATIFAIHKYFGFIIIMAIVTWRLFVTKRLYRNLLFENSFLGALTSITAPCLLIKENSSYYWMTNILDNILALLSARGKARALLHLTKLLLLFCLHFNIFENSSPNPEFFSSY